MKYAVKFGNSFNPSRGAIWTPLNSPTGSSGTGSETGSTGSAVTNGNFYLSRVTGADLWLRVEPSMFPSGNFSNDTFIANTVFDTERKFITSTERWWHEEVTTPVGTQDALRFRDPSLDTGSNTNPWFRRWHPQNSWGNATLISTVPASASKVYSEAFMELKLYYPTHSFQKAGYQGWSPGKHAKHWGGVSLGGVGATGGNPQTDGAFEAVFTTYGMRTFINGYNAKGDFPTVAAVSGASGAFATVPDISGVYGPVADFAGSASYLNRWANGIGIYAHDSRLQFNFEEMIFPCYSGTNVRVTFETGHQYEHRIWIKLNTPNQNNGELQWWLKIDNADFFLARHLNDVDWRGNSSEGFKDDGFIFFAGGFGSGWSWGDNDGYHPSGPKLNRQMYIIRKRTWFR